MKTLNVIILTIYCIFTLTACSNEGEKFIGEWINPRKSRDKILISKNGSSYIVERVSIEDAGFNFVNKDGSFKESGNVNGETMVIDERRKLTYIKGEKGDDDKILFENSEYFKKDVLEKLAKEKELEKIEKQRKQFEQEEPSKEEMAAQEKAVVDSIYAANFGKKDFNLGAMEPYLERRRQEYRIQWKFYQEQRKKEFENEHPKQ